MEPVSQGAAVLILVFQITASYGFSGVGAGVHTQQIPAQSLEFCENVMKPKAAKDFPNVPSSCLPTKK